MRGTAIQDLLKSPFDGSGQSAVAATLVTKVAVIAYAPAVAGGKIVSVAHAFARARPRGWAVNRWKYLNIPLTGATYSLHNALT